MWAGSRVSVAIVALAACGGGKDRPAAHDAGGAAAPADAGAAHLDDAAITARFAELRDARSLRCLLDTDGYTVLEALAIDTPPAVARVAAFAWFEPRRRDGDSPTLAAMQPAAHFLATVGDLDGLKALFEEADRMGLPARWQYDDVAYRARFGLPIEPHEDGQVRLGVVRELALAGKQGDAEAAYARLTPLDLSPPAIRADHVAALIALDRIADAKQLLEAASPAERGDLALAWLRIAIRKRAGVAEAVTALAASPSANRPALLATVRDARRAGFAAEVRPLRRALIDGIALEPQGGGSPLASELLEEAVVVGDLGERSRLATIVPDPVKRWVHAMREGSLADALAQARGRRDLARIWARHVAEGADPAFEETLAARVCDGIAARPAAPPAAEPTAGLTLDAHEENETIVGGCARADLSITLARAGGAGPADARVLAGDCSGACTPDQRTYATQLRAELERGVREGWATQADVDRVVDRCMFAGYLPGRVETVGGRQVALLVEHYVVAPALERKRFVLAYELCGSLAFSSPFGVTGDPWTLDQLTVKASADGRELQVDAATPTWRGVVYRATLPPAGCATAPVEEITPFTR